MAYVTNLFHAGLDFSEIKDTNTFYLSNYTDARMYFEKQNG